MQWVVDDAIIENSKLCYHYKNLLWLDNLLFMYYAKAIFFHMLDDNYHDVLLFYMVHHLRKYAGIGLFKVYS